MMRFATAGGRVLAGAVMALACWWTGRHAAAEDQFAQLAAKIPPQANVLLVLNVDKMFNSELAVKEGWREKYRHRYEGSPLLVPPQAREFVLGADLNLASLSPRWEVAMARMPDSITLQTVRDRVGGVGDNFDGRAAQWIAPDHCVVEFSPGMFGMIFPATRQQAAQWLAARGSSTEVGLAPYLKEALGYASQVGTEVIFAFDLAYITQPQQVEATVRNTDLLKDFDPVDVSKRLSTVRGATFGIRVTDRLTGSLKVDFEDDVSLLAPVAKEMLIRILKRIGADLPELESWESNSSGNRLSIRGEMSMEGMRRVFSLLEMDASLTGGQAAPPPRSTATDTRPVPPPPAPGARPGEQQRADTLAATQRYWNSLKRILVTIQNQGPQMDFASIALWIDKLARQIDRLPTTWVEPELVATGQAVAYDLHNLAANLHNGTIRWQSRVAEAQSAATSVSMTAVPIRRINYGGQWIFEFAPMANMNFNSGVAMQQQQAITNEEMQAANDAARQTVDAITQKMRAVREQLEQRYGKGTF